MSLQQILQAMEAEAAQEEHRLLTDARAQSEALLAEAAEQSARLRRGLEEEARGAVAEARARAEAEANLRASAERARALDARVTRVFDLAAERLSRARSETAYPSALASLVTEGLETLPPDWPAAIRYDPRDLPLVARSLAAGGRWAALDGSLTTWGGVVVEDVLGRLTVDNTLERRLERAQEQLRAQVVAALLEEPRDGERGDAPAASPGR